jgi:hypothetical protein
MTQSLKAILQLTLIVAALAALCAWIFPQRPEALIWSLRVGGLVIAVIIGIALFFNDRRPDLAPDILRQPFGGYFFRNGVAFTIRLTTANEIAWLEIFVQNHHTRPVVAHIVLRPYRRANSEMELIDEEIECPGGAVKVRVI